MSNINQSSKFSKLFDDFLNEFYKQGTPTNTTIIKHNILNKNTVEFGDQQSLNNFLYDIGNIVYQKQDNLIQEYHDFARLYCSYVKGFKVNQKYKNKLISDEYQELIKKVNDLSEELNKVQDEYDSRKMEKVENKEEELEKRYKAHKSGSEKIAAKLDEYITNYRDIEGETKIKSLTSVMHGYKIELQKLTQDIPEFAFKIFNAKIRCEEAVGVGNDNYLNYKTSYNMQINENNFVPYVAANNHMVRKMAKQLEESESKSLIQALKDGTSGIKGKKNNDMTLKYANKKAAIEFAELTHEQKVKCGMNTNYYKAISSNDISAFSTNNEIKANSLFNIKKISINHENTYTSQSESIGCISFDSVYVIPFNLPWLDKTLYNIKLEGEIEGIIIPDTGTEQYKIMKEFQENKCLIPRSAIVAIKPMLYLSLKKAHDNAGSIDVAIKHDYFFIGESLKSKNSWYSAAKNNDEIFMRVDDSFVIIAHELEDHCPLVGTNNNDEL